MIRFDRLRRGVARGGGIATAALGLAYAATVPALADPKGVGSCSSAGSYNPLCGQHPSLGPLAPVLGSKIGIVLALIWALVIVICAIFLLLGVGKVASAARDRRPGGLTHAGFDIGAPLAAVLIAALAPWLINAAQQ